MIKEHDETSEITITYANDPSQSQFTLCTNPYNKTKRIQINGSIFTSIYFDEVAICIDFIDNCGIKNKEMNEVYLNIFFYIDGAIDQYSDLILLINKNSSSELQLIKTLGSFGEKVYKNFTMEELVSFLTIDITN